MSKKGFYEKYVQDEDEKMMEIIHSNARKARDDKLVEKSKNHRKKGVSIIFIGISFILGLIVGALWT